MLVIEILKIKGQHVVTVSPSDTLQSVAERLHVNQVGAFIVLDGNGAIAGIISERDIVRALALAGRDALHRDVREFMTSQVHLAHSGETVDDLLARMNERRVRHMPVMDGDNMVGIVSIGDLVKSRIMVAQSEARILQDSVDAR